MGYARIILLVKNGINTVIMKNCMEKDISSIWVKIGNRGRKPLVIGGIYREQHLLKQGTPNLSDDPNLQYDRWCRTIQGWIKAANGSKCIVLGDFNMDFKKWQDPLYNSRLIEKTKAEIETRGFHQVVQEATRFWPGQEETLIDHCK